MQDKFLLEVENLRSSLFKMASIVEEQVEKAFTALETGNVELCRGMKAKDLEVDIYDNLIQTQCENILALFQPVAVDLRFIISALMINNQLERCGDIAVNIAQRVKKTAAQRELITESQVLEMAQQARQMLKNAIDSFMNNDVANAQKVLDSDVLVDKLNKQVFKFAVAKMQTEPALIEPCAHLIVLSRHIERMADHSTNIAENLIFHLEARIMSHRKKIPHIEEES